jgi:hypothetical protein
MGMLLVTRLRGSGGVVHGRMQVLARPPTAALVGKDAASHDDLAAPDTPGFPAAQRALETGCPDRAVRADRLGTAKDFGPLGEPELRVVLAARDSHAVGHFATFIWM